MVNELGQGLHVSVDKNGPLAGYLALMDSVWPEEDMVSSKPSRSPRTGTRTPPVAMPEASSVVAERELDVAVTVQRFEYRDWAMRERLHSAGVAVSAREPAPASASPSLSLSPEGTLSEGGGIFGMDL